MRRDRGDGRGLQSYAVGIRRQARAHVRGLTARAEARDAVIAVSARAIGIGRADLAHRARPARAAAVDVALVAVLHAVATRVHAAPAGVARAALAVGRCAARLAGPARLARAAAVNVAFVAVFDPIAARVHRRRQRRADARGAWHEVNAERDGQ